MKRFYFLLILLSISSLTYSQCLIRNINDNMVGEDPSTFVSIIASTEVPFLWGQGFVAECTGFFESVGIRAAFPGVVSAGTFRIYEGNGVSTVPVYEQEHPEIMVGETGDFIQVDLTEDFLMFQGDQYTFEYIVDGGVGAFFTGLNDVDFYAGGSLFQNVIEEFPGWDVQFQLSIIDAGDVVVIEEEEEEEEVLSTENFDVANAIKLFPNPSTDFIEISGLERSEGYSIYNILGAKVKSGTVSDGDRINVADFSNGLYLLTINNLNTTKFVKR